MGSQQLGSVPSVNMTQADATNGKRSRKQSRRLKNAALGYSVDVVFDADVSESTRWILANTCPFFTRFTL